MSKRIAALERALEFVCSCELLRAVSGSPWTGKPSCPHAREMLAVEERAIASVRPGQSAADRPWSVAESHLTTSFATSIKPTRKSHWTW